MFKKLLITLAATLLAFIGYVALQPAEFNVLRTATIAAAPADVFSHVNEFKKWGAWSPWAKLDPNAKTTFEGPAAGKGAVFGWSGDDKVGEGKMSIVDSTPNDAINIKLDIMKPFPGTSDVGFTFKPDGGKTIVSWTMTGTQGMMERAMCLIMGVNMDQMIGADYEKGLASLKAVVEGKG
ncbi:MAG: SRPBCC family protein [Hyphomicrobium sp.]